MYNSQDINICKKSVKHLVDLGIISLDSYNQMFSRLRLTLKKKTNKPEIMTVEETMSLLKVSRPTLYKLFDSGKLSKISIGGSTRVLLDDICKYLEASK